jgi:hypothetical protein
MAATRPLFSIAAVIDDAPDPVKSNRRIAETPETPETPHAAHRSSPTGIVHE